MSSQKGKGKKATEKDDVLSLFNSSSDERDFSGFESVPESPPRGTRKRLASAVQKVSKTPHSTSASGSGGKTKENAEALPANMINLDKLTPESVVKLKEALGLEAHKVSHNVENFSFDESENDDQSFSHFPDLTGDIGDNLFSEEKLNVTDDFDWDLPKLKAPEKGESIGESLAKLINTACTQQCQVVEVTDKYKIPANCDMMAAPKINEEIWSELNKFKRVQSTDKSLRDIQNLVCSGMIPILELAKIIKPYISQTPQIKTLVADSLTLLGQVQFQLSIRRRYLLRPSLKARYANICSIGTPVTGNLFGDDIGKELKKCETSIKVGKFSQNFPATGNYQYKNRTQGNYGAYGPMRRGRGARFRPYSRQPNYGNAAPQPYGQFGYQHRIQKNTRKSTTASATPANPN